MGKVRVINSTKWFQLEGGKKKLHQSVSVSQEPLTFHPLVFHLSGCSLLLHTTGESSPSEWLYYRPEFLDFWLKLHCVTRFIANSKFHPLSARLPLRRAWTCSSCWITALLSSQARLPRHVSGVWPHTQHHRARPTRLPRPALLSEGFAVPPQALGPGRPWLRRPRPARRHLTPQAPATGAAAASLPTESWLWWGKEPQV